MSYILDALKKADQEREQGQVPGLNAHPGQGQDVAPAPGGLSPLVWAGVGVALTLAGVLAWKAWPASAPAQAPTPGPAAATAPMAEPPVNAPPPGLAPDRTAAAPRRPAPATDGVAMQVDGASGQGHGWSAQPALSVAAPKPGKAAPDERPSTILGPVPKFNELPEAVRRELPTLQVGGAMHSPNPAQRMLVLNGQVFHEGDSPQNGLKLEEIRLKSAILNYQGQRFELQY